jgi:molybdopterin-guanine dinucleotide biosynthesis protein A
MKKQMAGVILSGGKSLRMGQDKAFIEIAGLPMIERILRVLGDLFEETLVVANQTDPYRRLDTSVYTDAIPGRGALGGLYTGLLFSSFDTAFCVGCDMPFLSPSLISYLADEIEGHDAVVPRTADGLQPLHAVYSKTCLGAIRRVIDENKEKIIDIYPLVNVKVIPESDFSFLAGWKESFLNVNTPEDLDQAKTRHP